MEQSSNRKWEEMDVNCLALIFGKLELKDLLLAVPFVCKPWHKASLDPTCWKTLPFHKLNLWSWSPFITSFCSAYNIQFFSFSGLLKLAVSRGQGSVTGIVLPDSDVDIEDLDLIANECPLLQWLGLSRLDCEAEKHIPKLISKWKDFQWLISIRGFNYYFEQTIEEVGKNCPNFTGLLFHHTPVSHGVAAAIAASVPGLKDLLLNGCFLQKEDLLIILNGCKGLTRLQIKECPGFSMDDEVLKLTTPIKSFVFKAMEEVDYGDECYGLSMSDVYDGNSDDGYEL